MQYDLFTPSGKTSPECSPTPPTHSDVSWGDLPDRIPHSFQAEGSDGPTRVWLLDPNAGLPGEYSTLNLRAWPNDASVCSLSQVLEKGRIHLKYFLSAKACSGIIRRAEKRGKALPALLARALRAVADSEQISNSGGGSYQLAPSLAASGRGTERTGESRGQDCVIPVPLCPEISGAVSSKWAKGTGGPAGDECYNLIGQGPVLPILEAGARTGKSTTDVRAGFGIGEDGDPMYTLQAGKQHAIAFQERGRDGGRVLDYQDDLSYTLTSPKGGGRRQELNIVAPQSIGFSCKDYGADASDDVSQTLRAMEFDESHANGGGQVAVAFKASHFKRGKQEDPCHPLAAGAHAPAIAMAFETPVARNGRGAPEDVCPPLKAESGQTGKGDSAPCVMVQEPDTPWAVRRLLPVECEKLQGFSPGYTDILYRGKPAADGPRYRALGNSMAVNVMRWIGKRILAVESTKERG